MNICAVNDKRAEKEFFIIAGCNGAGKTTASYTVLPDIIHCQEFVNADEIARGLSPFAPEGVAIQAGRIMLERVHELFEEGKTFALETTLSTRSYKNYIVCAQRLGYKVTLLFFWLKSANLAEDRVRERVIAGGHNIPLDVIFRRYEKGLINLREIFLPICDKVLIFDNSFGDSELIFEKSESAEQILNSEKYEKVIGYGTLS